LSWFLLTLQDTDRSISQSCGRVPSNETENHVHKRMEGYVTFHIMISNYEKWNISSDIHLTEHTTFMEYQYPKK